MIRIRGLLLSAVGVSLALGSFGCCCPPAYYCRPTGWYCQTSVPTYSYSAPMCPSYTTPACPPGSGLARVPEPTPMPPR